MNSMRSLAGIPAPPTPVAERRPLAVIIVSYNVRELLLRALQSLQPPHQLARDIIVVDNASHDGSLSAVKQQFPNVKAVSMGKNAGFSAAVNAGAAAAQEQHDLLILNPDASLKPGDIEVMEQRLRFFHKADVLGFRQVDSSGNLQLSVGPAPSFVWETARMLVQKRMDAGSRFVSRVMEKILAKPLSVPWVAGSCMVVRRDAFNAIGGFDERFFLYFEDLDFCLRVRNARGSDVIFDPTITIEHVRGASSNQAPMLSRTAYRRSQLHYWEVHRGKNARRVMELYLRARNELPEHTAALSS